MQSNNLTIEMTNFKEKYKKEVVPSLMEKFQYKNVMAVPSIEKVVVNIGVGRDAVSRSGDDLKKFMKAIESELALITGQKPSPRKAKKSISGFKLREGIVVGYKVTLRGQRMYDFLDRMIHVALPRSRDFKGLNLSGFDKNGNFSFGIKEHIIFPEVSAEKIRDIFGFEITVKTTASTKEEGMELLKKSGFPLKQK